MTEVQGLELEIARWAKMMKRRGKSGIPATVVGLTQNCVHANFCYGNSPFSPRPDLRGESNHTQKGDKKGEDGYFSKSSLRLQ